jgi:hypothetical protein
MQQEPTMSHRRSSSPSLRWFKPSLECLEERNLLSNSGYTSFLYQLTNVIDQNIQQTNLLQFALLGDVKAFNAAPRDTGALIKLEIDSTFFLQQAGRVQQLMSVYSDLLLFGEGSGLVTNDLSPIGMEPPIVSTFGGKTTVTPNPHNQTDTQYFDAKEQSYQEQLSTLQDNIDIDEANMIAALFAFFSGSGVLQSSPNQSPQQGTQTNGTVTENITKAPADTSEADGAIAQSVTVTNPSNSPVAVMVSYSATDGTSTSQSDTCTNGTITVQDGAPPSAPGVVGTWTTTVTGLPTQTNTTTWTQ